MIVASEATILGTVNQCTFGLSLSKLSAEVLPAVDLVADVTRTSPRSRPSLALRLRSPREIPLPLLTNVLLLRWDTQAR